MSVWADDDFGKWVETTWQFTINYQLPCVPGLILNPTGIPDCNEYMIGSGIFTLPFDDLSNGSCAYEVSVVDFDTLVDITTVVPEITVTQSTFHAADPTLPNELSVLVMGGISMVETDEAKEKTINLRMTLSDPDVGYLATDPFYDFEIVFYRENLCT